MNEGRDSNGRFAPGNQIAKGHKGAGGRPPRALEERYMRALVQAMPIKRFREVCEVHAARALEGDLATFRTFLDRLLGKARESLRVEGLSDALRGLLLDLETACDSEGPGGEPGETAS